MESLMESPVRNKDRVTHHKKQERMVVKNGNPTVKDIIQGNLDLWFIPNKGLCLVTNYNNKLYYNKFISEISGLQSTIIDADGTLADITTKFNTLLDKLEASGILG